MAAATRGGGQLPGRPQPALCGASPCCQSVSPEKPGAVVSCWPFSGDRHRPSPRLPPSPNNEHRIGARNKDGALVTAAQPAGDLAGRPAAGVPVLELERVSKLYPGQPPVRALDQ